MVRTVESVAEARAPLSKEKVLRAAIALADEEGIAALTMRRLAQQLGVEAMSLYHYVRSKDDILDASLDLVLQEIAISPRGTDWRAALRADAIAAHGVLRRHPWATDRMMSAARPSMARLRFMESVLANLRSAGFDPEQTDHAYHTLDSHITGFTLWQVSMPVESEDLPTLGARFLRELPVDEFPFVAEHVEHHMAGIGNSGASEFAFGLDLILDGLERLLAADPPKSGTGRGGRTR